MSIEIGKNTFVKIRMLLTCILFTVCTSVMGQEDTHNKDSIDFEFAIKELELNYAGFPTLVNDSNRAEYESMKERFRHEIRNKECNALDAVGSLFGWFGDSHLRLGGYPVQFASVQKMQSGNKDQIPDYDPQAERHGKTD